MSKNKYRSCASNIVLRSYEDLINDHEAAPSIIDIRQPENAIVNMPIEKLRPFKNHPFKVIHDAEMDGLIESIKMLGVVQPIVTRPVGDFYEIISGHRRVYAAKEAGLNKIPAKIVYCDNVTAKRYNVDSNMCQKKILPSEKAVYEKMRRDAIKRLGEKNSTQNVEMSSTQDVEKNSNIDLVGKEHEAIAFSEAMSSIEGASVSNIAKEALTQWADGKLTYEEAMRIVLEHYGFPKQT